MKKNCEFCGGSGQINFFQGVSRFLLTIEECPQCAGTGRQLDAPETPQGKSTKRTKKRKDKTKS